MHGTPHVFGVTQLFGGTNKIGNLYYFDIDYSSMVQHQVVLEKDVDDISGKMN